MKKSTIILAGVFIAITITICSFMQSKGETKVYKAENDVKGKQIALATSTELYWVYLDKKNLKWKMKIEGGKIYAYDQKGEAFLMGEVENGLVYRVKRGERYSTEGKVKDGKILDDDTDKIIGFYEGNKEQAAAALVAGMFR